MLFLERSLKSTSLKATQPAPAFTAATDATVIVAFNAGNLFQVATAIKKDHPSAPIIIALDNDQPGIEKGTAAAEAIGAPFVVPEFKDLSSKPTDFNDLACLEGIDTVRTQLAKIKVHTLGDAILTLKDFASRPFEPRENFLNPWLKNKSLIMIYAMRGIGKTHFAFAAVAAVAAGESFGPWQCEKSVPCCYVDAEMAEQDLQERILGAGYHAKDFKSPLYIYSDVFAFQLGLSTVNLFDENWRKSFEEFLKTKQIKLVSIDNVSSAAPGADENAKAEWDSINQWLLRLRKMGISVILVHHAGWNDEHSRGTSAREDNLDVVIRLRQPKGYVATDGARFVTNFTKCRTYAEDKSLLSDYEFKLEQGISGYCEWSHCKATVSKKLAVKQMLKQGFEPKAICEEIGVTKGYVSKCKTELEKLESGDILG